MSPTVEGLNDIALVNKSSQSNTVSLVRRDHSVTFRQTTQVNTPGHNPSQTGQYSIWPE